MKHSETTGKRAEEKREKQTVHFTVLSTCACAFVAEDLGHLAVGARETDLAVALLERDACVVVEQHTAQSAPDACFDWTSCRHNRDCCDCCEHTPEPSCCHPLTLPLCALHALSLALKPVVQSLRGTKKKQVHGNDGRHDNGDRTAVCRV